MNKTQARRQQYRRGHYAEWLALAWMVLKGYRPRALRYKTPVGEIDLVLTRGNLLVFVEVKGRNSAADAARAVHRTNQSRVVRAAQHYLAAHPAAAGCMVRFDVCLVPWYRLPTHIPHAFEAM